jgi:hypothetical protein
MGETIWGCHKMRDPRVTMVVSCCFNTKSWSNFHDLNETWRYPHRLEAETSMERTGF